jgi:hypothetical protein
MSELSAAEAVATLVDPARRYPATYIELAPRTAGLYVWWARRSVVFGVHGTRMGEAYVYYVGKASSSAGLRGRLATHVKGSARSSTLRLTLAALGAGSGDVARSGESRIALSASYEAEVSQWIRENMDVSWVEVSAPGALEREVVAALKPPLNLDLGAAHADHGLVKDARNAMRAQAVGWPARG